FDDDPIVADRDAGLALGGEQLLGENLLRRRRFEQDRDCLLAIGNEQFFDGFAAGRVRKQARGVLVGKEERAQMAAILGDEFPFDLEPAGNLRLPAKFNRGAFLLRGLGELERARSVRRESLRRRKTRRRNTETRDEHEQAVFHRSATKLQQPNLPARSSRPCAAMSTGPPGFASPLPGPFSFGRAMCAVRSPVLAAAARSLVWAATIMQSAGAQLNASA